jgi:MEMO1 family protein
MPAVRPAAVAGRFYPDDPRKLAACVERYIADAGQRVPARAVIAPHAGYVYSGAIAGHAYAALAGARGVRRVVVAGPAHRVYVSGIAIPGTGAFATPLGTMALDADALALLRGVEGVETHDGAHALEHSIEVQLPFVRSLFPDARLVPLVVGDADATLMASVLDRLWDEESVLVVSSDLSHYLTWSGARARDGDTARAIERLDASLVPEDACGAFPINGLLRLARQRGLDARVLDLRNSGDTAGDRERVVGYGAFAFTHEAAHG